VEASGFGRKDMRILDEVSAIYIRFGCKTHDIQYMETVKDEVKLSEDDDYDDEDSNEFEDDTGIPSKTPAARCEEDSEAKGSAVVVEEKVHTSSRTPSPSPLLTEMTAALHLNGIKDIVSSDLTKERARQQRKYHSKRGARHAGRPQGSKAKQDTRIKLDRGGMWD
jgi:RIO kinase 2